MEQSAGVLILHRNLLHSFLSHEIAMQAQKWVNEDTSDQKVLFEPRRFTGYIRFVTGFYDRIETLLRDRRIPRTDILYEDILKHPEDIENRLSAALSRVGAELRSEPGKTAKLRRQDRRPMASDKVRNPDEMLSFLRGIGLETANDGTVAVLTSRFGEALRHASAPLAGS